MKSFNNYLNESKKLDDYIFEEEIIQEGFWAWLGGILAAGLALVGAGIAKLFKWMFSEAEKNVKENGGEYKVNDESVGILTGGRGEGGNDDEDGKDGKKSKNKGKGLDEKKIIVGAMDDKQIDKFLSITKSNSGGPFNDYYKFISNYDEDKKVKQTIYVNYDKDTVCLMFLQSDDEQNFYIEHITPYKGINIEKNIFAIVKDKIVSILKNTYSTYANLRVSYKDALKYFDGLKFSKKYKAYIFPDDIGDEKPKNNGQLSKEEVIDFIKNPSKYPISINKVDKETLSKWCEKEGKDDNKDYFNAILKYQSDNDSLTIYSMFIERQISEANDEEDNKETEEQTKSATIGVMFLDESQKESVVIENICFVPSIDGEDLPETLLSENIFNAIEKTLSIKKENINISNEVAKKFNSKAKSTQMLPQEVVDDVVNHPEKREVVINEIEKDALNKWCETIGKDQNQKTYYDKISEYQKKHNDNLIYSLVVSTEVKEAEEKKEDNVGIIGVMFVSKIEDEVKENLNVFEEEEEKKDEPKEDNKEEKKDDSENKEEKSAKYRIERIYFVNELLHDTVNMKSTMLTDNIIKQLEEKLSVKEDEIALSKEVEKQFQINTDKDNDKESSEKDDESKGNDSDKDNDKEDKEDEKEKDKEKTEDDKLIPDEIVEAIHNDMKDLTLDIEELKDKKDFEKLIEEIKESKKYDIEKITQFQKDNENDDIFKINVSKEKDSYIIGFIFLGEKLNEAEQSDKTEIYFHQAFTIFEDEPGDKFKEDVHNALDKWSKESGFEIVYNDDYNDEFNNPEEADKEEDKEDKEENKETEEVKKEIEQKSEETEKEIEKTEKEVVQELDDNEDLDNDDVKDQKKEIKELTAEQKKKIKELEKEYQKKVEEMDEKHSKERKGHSMKEYEEIIEKQDKELEELKAEYDKKIENIVKNIEKSEDKEEKEEKKEKTNKDDDKDEKTSKENKDKKDDKKSLKETPKEDKKEKVKKEAEEVNKEAEDIKKEVEDLTEAKDPYKNINKNLEDKLNITLALFIKKQEEFNKAFNSWKEATINKDETKAKEFEKKFNKAKNDLELIKIELNNNKENLKNFKNPSNVIDEGLDTDNLDWKLSAWFSRDSKQKDLFNRVLNDPSTLEIALTDGFDMQGLVNFTYDNVKSDTEVDYVYQLEQLLNYLKGGK